MALESYDAHQPYESFDAAKVLLQVFSRTRSLGNATTRNRSRRRRLSTKSLDDDDPEYSGLRRPGDEKTKQVFSGKRLMFLAYQSIGVIYGDIGTSPLYVFSSTFVDTKPTRENVQCRNSIHSLACRG